MDNYIYWFSIAVVLLMVEMVSGTFYMLMLSLAFGAGGIAAYAGLNNQYQLGLAALVGIAGIVILRRIKSKPQDIQDLDIGQSVTVVTWHDDGTARVRYRGTEWDAELESVGISRDQPFYIKATRGSTLILTHSKSQ